MQQTTVNKHQLNYEVPKQCPYCFKKGFSQQLPGKTAYAPGNTEWNLELVFECVECKRMYKGVYMKSAQQAYNNLPCFDLISLSPKDLEIPSVSDRLQKMSPRGVDLYKQSLYAEAYDFPLIAGMGLRNAIENLLKDYAEQYNGKSEKEVEGWNLYETIKQVVTDISIHDDAQSIRILGNDQCHWKIDYPEYELNKFKIFVFSVVGWLESRLSMNELNEEISSKAARIRAEKRAIK